ncbi:hypothetical protein OIDMADRAFT_23982 [Oidiodendron maius Zn]|uniref:Uncharacterized protein n=1 Tax=Oidiodendron maius (strain Zn) TaxID=913774 RepID=A0A0C3DU60_OIDMZ|nr:hypothetical protein OIDMADRAFT_23982 [Oidiodendron maius Zn]
MDNRDIRCCGHVADLGRRLSAHGSRGNGRKGGSGPPGRAEEGSIEGKGGEGRKSAATFLLPGRLHPIRDPDTRGSLSTLPTRARAELQPADQGEGRRRAVLSDCFLSLAGSLSWPPLTTPILSFPFAHLFLLAREGVDQPLRRQMRSCPRSAYDAGPTLLPLPSLTPRPQTQISYGGGWNERPAVCQMHAPGPVVSLVALLVRRLGLQNGMGDRV